MLNFLKWLIAEKEMSELCRWRVEWECHRRWLAEFTTVGEVLDHIKTEVEKGGAEPLTRFRDRLRQISDLEEAESAIGTANRRAECFELLARDSIADLAATRKQLEESQAAHSALAQEHCVVLGAKDLELSEAQAAVKANHEWHQIYDDYGGYPDSELCNINLGVIGSLKATALSAKEAP